MSDAEGPTRRALLVGSAGAALVAALAGCSDPAPPPVPPPPDPDDALRESAAARERELLLAYDAALLADPGLAPRLSPLRAHHEEHLAALVGPSPTPSAGPSFAALPTVVPGGSPVTLAAAERAAATRHAADAVSARDRDLAALLASLSASEQSHPVALA
jgi:hypothetical protein